MKGIVFATNNKHKLDEIRKIAAGKLQILSLSDINCHEDIEETGTTLEANALIKAKYVKDTYGYDCFADDTGLEVEALDGLPGVYSSRYAGEACRPADNMNKLLTVLKDTENRKARFRTVIALILNNEEHYFEGIINGEITLEERGKAGFGYDPLFQPEGYSQTFAELGDDIKNSISHRALATQKLMKFLLK
ncbi:MAG: non-canonical purine NTP diphosphatase [Fermentimonas sp.]|jgi:XTP/dITP diphosphohydrolase|nr:non-canonical purine NTP diphosphatase [Fermentimonas sp.]MDD4008317.1 non-canonical purine NTP diphosphatase [Fermentimonas sp.]MDD4696725.1 non-canonical purine NTP diphosphatase [Fermentimonas sp.]